MKCDVMCHVHVGIFYNVTDTRIYHDVIVQYFYDRCVLLNCSLKTTPIINHRLI